MSKKLVNLHQNWQSRKPISLHPLGVWSWFLLWKPYDKCKNMGKWLYCLFAWLYMSDTVASLLHAISAWFCYVTALWNCYQWVARGRKPLTDFLFSTQLFYLSTYIYIHPYTSMVPIFSMILSLAGVFTAWLYNNSNGEIPNDLWAFVRYENNMLGTWRSHSLGCS